MFFTTTRRYAYLPIIAVLALSALILLALLPAVAQAQEETASTKNSGASHSVLSVVVGPGESLWSISAEQLGPQATPQQVAERAEQIYALNRNQIGDDPNRIFPGQELLVPAMGEEPTPHQEGSSAGAVRSAPQATGSVAQEAIPRGSAAKKSATKPVSKETAAKPAQASAESPATHKAATRPGSVAAASSVEVELGRRLLGLAVLALTLAVGVFGAWKLPMRRTTRWDAERWGIPTGYGAGRYAYSGELDVMTKTERGESRERSTQRLAPAAHHRGLLLLRDLQDHHKDPAGLAPVRFGPGTNGSEANGARAEKLPNGRVQAARRVTVGR